MFCGLLHTSLWSIYYLTVPTVAVIRNCNGPPPQPSRLAPHHFRLTCSHALTAVVCVVLEFIVYRKTVSIETLVCLFIVIIGAYIYASNRLVFHFVGYCWATANIILMALNQVMIKHIGPDFNAWEMSMYMNVQSVLIFVVTMPFTGTPQDSYSS